MTFEKYVCWKPDRVFQVMNTQAEYASDDIFLAVHSHYPITLQQTRYSQEAGISDTRWEVDPQEFLSDFLSTREGYQPQVAVLGGSGSGKSHFIHWLDVSIPRSNSREVLTVPKTGTSLRGVVKLLLDRLPDDQGQAYRQQFLDIGQHVSTTTQRRERLIAEIALAVKADRPRAEDQTLQDVENDLISRLPDMFRDPVLVAHWTSDGTTIDRLLAHIEQPESKYERLEEERLFNTADLPLEGMQFVQMARPTQLLLNELRASPDDAQLAVEIINRNLDDAIIHLLNFSGDDLVNLMLDIRRYLRRDGKELVLLIEDFARMQGVDRALLQALIEKPGPGPESLCTMRWAMAATKGYYGRLERTVQTRLTHIVDMDVPQARLGENGLERFASRYLNAARLTPEELSAWQEGGAAPEDLPNACESCQYRVVCHAAFGQMDRRGLYPFNSAALRTMSARKNQDIEVLFNPRSVIGSVLAEVLDRYPGMLANGEFPPGVLLRSMGGSHLPAAIESHLESLVDPVTFQRQLTTLELWGRPGIPLELPAALYEAFDLKPPDLSGIGSLKPVIPPVGPGPAIPASVDARIASLREWGAGRAPLSEVAGTYFRDLVYEAIESYIDWDAHNLSQAVFARRSGGGSPFSARQIVFRNQVMNVAPRSAVVLTIPLRADSETALRDAVIALEGLHQFRTHESWAFPNGQQTFLKVAHCLGEWSSELLPQLLSVHARNGDWNPIRAGVELLAVGAAMAGRLTASATEAEALNSLFSKWPDAQNQDGSNEWRALYRDIYRKKETIERAVRARSSATKGGRAGPIIDPTEILLALREVRRDWQLRWSAPANTTGLPEPFESVATLHGITRSRLAEAARTEHQRRLAWLQTVRTYVPAGVSRGEIIAAFDALQTVAADEAVAVPVSLQARFELALNDFKSAHFDAGVRSAELLKGAESPVHVLPQLGTGEVNAVDITTRFLDVSNQYLQALTGSLEARLADLQRQAGGIDVAADKNRIETSLASLSTALARIEAA